MSAAVYTYSARSVPEAHDHQRVACERLAHELGYETVLSYHDDSGTRVALERLLADVREGKVSVLFVGGLDRLGRTVEALLPVLETLHDADVNLYAAANGKVPLPESPVAASLLAIATSYEKARAESIMR